MAETDTPTPPPSSERIEELQIERELQDSYLTYAMSTIMDRALPDVRDGLKPSQRRVLVAMNDLNLTPGRKHIKCAKIAGDTSGNYHPHGEAVIYPTLVRMAQDWSMRYPLIDGQGNFGSSDGDPPAAMRYTEARMAPPTVEMMADLELDTVDFQPNYDERMQEPVVLPSKLPNLLVNGSTGIAVGMACNLLPHNLREICDAIVHMLEHPDCELASLLAIVPGPDFPTGGIVMGRDGIIEGYKTGRGKLTLRARHHIETQKNGRESIIIDELPYGVIRKSIVEAVAEAVKNDRMRDVSAVNDESGRQHKVRIVIDLKRDADPQVVLNQLWQFTPAQVTVSMINIALVNRQPRTMGLKELIQYFIDHRRVVITRRTRFLLKKAQQRGHILEGLIFAVCDIDEVVRLIRASSTREEAIARLRARAFRIAPDHPAAPKIPARLMERASAETGILLSQAQAEAIGRLQLIQLVGLEIEKLVGEYRQVVEEIEGYEMLLADPSAIDDVIREDTLEMKEKFGDERRTEISGQAASALSMEALVPREDVVVTVSHNGYIKRLPVATYRAQGRGGRGIRGSENREGDFVEHLFVANTHDYLLFFTNKGRVYERRVYDVPEASRTSIGRSIANLLSLQQGEKIASVLSIRDFAKAEQFLLFATARGVVKKTALGAFANIKSSGIIAIGLDEDDSLIAVEVTSGIDQVLLGTRRGMAVRFRESDVRSMGRPAGGVRGADLEKDDAVVSMVVVPGNADPRKVMVLTACENGFGKRTPVEEYRLTRRGGKGVINIKTTDRNGPVVGMLPVEDADELMMITAKGILIRTRVSEIRETGRNAAGVKLISLDEGDVLVAMARVERDDDEPTDSAKTPTPAPSEPDSARPSPSAPESDSATASPSDPATPPSPAPESASSPETPA